MTISSEATLAIAPVATLAIWPHSFHWTRETKSWIAVDIIENVHRVAELDSIGSKAELLLAKPRVRRDLPVRFKDISVRVQSFNQRLHKVVHRDLLHMSFFRVQAFLTIQVHLVHETHPWQPKCPVTSNDTSSIHWLAAVHAHGGHLHVLVHQAATPSHAVGAEVTAHTRCAESGAHVAVAHSLVGDHQASSSGYFGQGKQMDLGASFVRSLQGGAGCVAADESWRRGQEQFILAVLLQAASSGHLPGQRTSSLQNVCTVLGCSRQGGVTSWRVKADVVLGVSVPDARATFPFAPVSTTVILRCPGATSTTIVPFADSGVPCTPNTGAARISIGRRGTKIGRVGADGVHN